MSIAFSKYHALGNDFVVLEQPEADAVSPALARRLCDRHFGIGADGVLVLTPSERALTELSILNADGSRPEMCGNGLRCVARHLERTRQPGTHFAVGTDAGVLECQLSDHDGDRWVSISLGKAEHLGSLRVSNTRGGDSFARVRIGNPHAVLFDHDYDLAAIDRLGPEVCALIPGGANVEFVRVLSPSAVEVVVWERGVGRTLACGTGAGAVVAAAAEAGRVPYDEAVAVTLPGGTLQVLVRHADRHVTLRGPAQHVYDGVVATHFAEN